MTLPQQARDEITEADPELGESSNGVFAEIGHAFLSQHLGGAWETFSKHISNQSLSTLHFAAKFMEKHSPIAVIAATELAELKAKFEELEAEVRAAGLDATLRQFLMRQIRAIIRAIDDYHLTGGQRLLDLCDQTVGHVVADPATRDSLAKSSVGKKFAEALSVLANAVTVSQVVGPAIEWGKKVYQLLGGPGA